MEGKEQDGTGTATAAGEPPANPPTPFDAPWEFVGPTTATRNYLIIDRQGVCRVTVKSTEGKEAEALRTVKLVVRAPAMRVLLQHVRDELLRDDDGARFGGEIKLLNDELERIGDTPIS